MNSAIVISNTPKPSMLARGVFMTSPSISVQGPLYRVEVLRRSADRSCARASRFITAIADGWTLGVFVQDLFAAYCSRRCARDRTRTSAGAAQSYTDWGADRACVLASRRSWSNARRFGRTYLAERRAALEQIGERMPDAIVTSAPIAVSPVTLGRRRARTGAAQWAPRCSPHCLTAFQIAMSRWTGVGGHRRGHACAANRNKQDVRETMGYLLGHRVLCAGRWIAQRSLRR